MNISSKFLDYLYDRIDHSRLTDNLFSQILCLFLTHVNYIGKLLYGDCNQNWFLCAQFIKPALAIS